RRFTGESVPVDTQAIGRGRIGFVERVPKIFVATAGALEYPRWRFMLTVMIARSLRYYIEGTLAVFYGRTVIDLIKRYGFMVLAIVIGACLLGLAIYLLMQRRRKAIKGGTTA